MKEQFKCALVTGATSGIGEAVARLLAEKGIPLLLTGRQKERLDQLAEELGKRVAVETFVADLSSPHEREILLAKIRERAPDLIINNAGLGLYGEAVKYPNAKSLEIVQVNVEALVDVAIEAARTLLAAKRPGVILNVSSAISQLVSPGFTIYGATKAFVNHFSESFDWELRGRGIRVLAACPGVVKTNFRERAGGVTIESERGRYLGSADRAL